MMKKLLSIFLILECLMLSIACQTVNDIDSYLIKQYEAGNLNGNIVVIKNGKTLYEKSFGYADGSKEKLLTKDYRFGIGSIYKEFPAAAIMQLSEKGLLSIDDKISEHLSNLPAWSQSISIKNLLQYSGGLPMIRWDEYFGNGESITDTKILNDLGRITELEFQPGTEYLYTNNSPFLLKTIVEQISGKPFAHYVSENIYPVAGLSSTIIQEQYPYLNMTMMANPVNADFEEDQYNLSISGMLFATTARDISSWFKALDSFIIISEASVTFLSERLNNNLEYESPLGQTIWDDGSLIEHTHHGSMGNYECVVRHFKNDDLIITILTNQKNGNVYEISDKIYELTQN